MGVEQPGVCEDCGSPLDRGQRYCLGCGARIGARSPQLVELLRRTAGSRAVQGSPASGAVSDARQTVAPALGLTLPGFRISTLLVLVFLGFGVLLGNVAKSRDGYALAATARPRLKVVLPPPTASASSSSPPPSSPASTSEPPLSESTPTPAAASPTTPTSTSAPPAASKTATPESSASGESGSSEGGSSGTPSGHSSSKLPPVKHVFVIMLSNQPYAAVFGPSSTAPYLSGTLEHQGELLVRYYAVAHEELASEIGLLSGQGPTTETAANCPTYGDIAPATAGAEQQVIGQGCVYPRATQTLAGQLTAKRLGWRAYVEGTGEAGTQVAACGHPAAGLKDPTSGQLQPGPYATFRNPFVYFHSVIDSPTCAADDVGLNKLSADLADSKHAPSFSYIAPNRCHDGNPTPCAAGAPSGLPAADGFLKKVVPEILHSKSYKEGGLLLITVDEAPSGGEYGDSSSCCGQPRFPNLPASAGPAAGLPANGGGEVGALLLSSFVKPGTTSQEKYNHFSLLRTIEDLFKLKHLGYAGSAGVTSFEPAVFSAYTPH